jgi:hypothetical protein
LRYSSSRKKKKEKERVVTSSLLMMILKYLRYNKKNRLKERGKRLKKNINSLTAQTKMKINLLKKL